MTLKPNIDFFEEERAALDGWEWPAPPAIPKPKRDQLICKIEDMVNTAIESLRSGISKQAAEAVFDDLKSFFDINLSPYDMTIYVTLIDDMGARVSLLELALDAARNIEPGSLDGTEESPNPYITVARRLRKIAAELEEIATVIKSPDIPPN